MHDAGSAAQVAVNRVVATFGVVGRVLGRLPQEDGHMTMRLAHLGIVARDADRLAAFYRRVFGCRDRRTSTVLSGETVSQGNGLPNSEIYSVWLTLPGVETPFLEIHQYRETTDRPPPRVNEPGCAHFSFEVGDIRAMRDDIIRAGGRVQGEITNLGTVDAPFLAVYMRDPEGNLIELEEV